jgi:hypothetical protein
LRNLQYQIMCNTIWFWAPFGPPGPGNFYRLPTPLFGTARYAWPRFSKSHTVQYYDIPATPSNYRQTLTKKTHHLHERIHGFVAKYRSWIDKFLTASLLRDVVQRRSVACFRRFGTTHRFLLQVSNRLNTRRQPHSGGSMRLRKINFCWTKNGLLKAQRKTKHVFCGQNAFEVCSVVLEDNTIKRNEVT